ncbi:hypothetical protein BB560_001540 [Smittium megazygosporum]|uniref:Uncharacterized protein n=1 Tax=Smittium megazygosporum TaxID=133381 RepID=A0A2T9ZHA1_9FUNG|nr:hypothetical protein BB560_001540 [Smittium megazygosporum]
MDPGIFDFTAEFATGLDEILDLHSRTLEKLANNSESCAKNTENTCFKADSVLSMLLFHNKRFFFLAPPRFFFLQIEEFQLVNSQLSDSLLDFRKTFSENEPSSINGIQEYDKETREEIDTALKRFQKEKAKSLEKLEISHKRKLVKYAHEMSLYL